MTDLDERMEDGAVKVYDSAMADEFPVLKAFQQYIDAEQAKSRKRVLMLCLFFSFVLTVVIAVFVALLIAAGTRNQTLNDRMVEYVMKSREQAPAPVVQANQDNAALRALSDKLESLQKSIDEDRSRAEKVSAEAAASTKRPTVEALEIERLKALLAAEKEKAAAEREKQRQAELEDYRRKHYPELYGLKPAKTPSSSSGSRRSVQLEDEEADREIESILKEFKAIDYFDEDEEDERPTSVRRPSKRTEQKKDATPSEDGVRAPRGVTDSSGNTWGIPEE